ncbi:uncharacterized protein LOC116766932 [Danaus plexippus]|uniref:uncharacterized protein LOC116766932 n=1 Tax=Danaus plexippus TaxID=13037 RepID=UPI002AB267A0|nr:uncharacterized protein LOC116766932 [Danaus plexippus]
MNRIFVLQILFTLANGASQQRYGETNQYPTYTTVASLYNENQFPYKTSYGSDVASFPEATRYPNYNSAYSTVTPYPYNSAGSNINYQSGYTTPSYGSDQSYGYGQGYSGQSYGQGVSTYEMPFMKYNEGYCVNRSPQNGIWVDSLTGMWYGVEFIQHLAGDARVDYDRTCIVIHISEPADQPNTENPPHHVQHMTARFHQEFRNLRLLWDEAGQTIEYAMYFRNDSAGYWQVFHGQNGTLTIRPNYQQFDGTVQVLKAVNDHLVLNFCQEASNGRPAQLYTVLFSREPGAMLRWEIESVHALLQNKKLSVASRRMVCGNGAEKPILSVLFSLTSCVFVFVVRSS